MRQSIFRVAIQKKGRIQEESLRFLREKGFDFPKKFGRKLVIRALNAPVELVLVRHADIPRFVELGAAEMGIVGEDKLIEKEFKVEVCKKLPFGRCSLVIAVPEKGKIKKIVDLENERIATSYPEILKHFLKEKKISASIVKLTGSVEAAIELNLADAICDIVQTGASLEAHNLVPVAKVQDFQAVLIKNPSVKKDTANNLFSKCDEKR